MQSCLYYSKLGNALCHYVKYTAFATSILKFPFQPIRYLSKSQCAQLLYSSPRHNSTYIESLQKVSTSSSIEIYKDEKTVEGAQETQALMSGSREDVEPLPASWTSNRRVRHRSAIKVISKWLDQGNHRVRNKPRQVLLNAVNRNLRARFRAALKDAPDLGAFNDRNNRGLSARLRKLVRRPSLEVLGKWLDMQDERERAIYWRNVRAVVSETALPTMLLCHLTGSQLTTKMESALKQRGFHATDIAIWAWVLEGSDPSKKAARLLAMPKSVFRPPFLLLEILRHDIQEVEIVRALLVYAWATLLSPKSQRATRPSEQLLESIESLADISTMPHTEISNVFPDDMEQTTFDVLISRLLAHVRRVYPPAVVTIAHMAATYMHDIIVRDRMTREMDPQQHSHLSKILNRLLCWLALPSVGRPFKSMYHNWHAQRVLLVAASQSRPPLIIDQKGYEAVQRVLIALRKSAEEARSTSLQARDWPPWRIDQDGMDAHRSPEDDMSRAVYAVREMLAAGYNARERSISYRILGGREADGTPTIQTRSIVSKDRARPSSEAPELILWTSRIRATRDAQEAWSAFKKFRELGGKPKPSTYFAMMMKLNADDKRSNTQSIDVVPGDGQEVLPPSSDNFSTFYKEELKPPSLDVLYDSMISAGLKPEGRLLRFLVIHARTIAHAVKYLHDSTLSSSFVRYLIGDSSLPPKLPLNKDTVKTLNSFVKLLCRSHNAGLYVARSAPNIPNDGRIFANLEGLYKRSTEVLKINPLAHAINLVGTSQTTSRVVWYAIFDVLARPGTTIDPSIAGTSQNDIYTWRVLVAMLQDFRNTKLALDLKGFLLICRCLEKAIIASYESPKGFIREDAISLVKGEFAKLSWAADGDSGVPELPALLHEFDAAILHSYIRVLGLAEDYVAVVETLEWMVRHHKHLQETAIQSKNGEKLLRRTIIAIGVFGNGSQYEQRMREAVESIEGWEWPDTEDINAYVEMREKRDDVAGENNS